MGRGGGGVVVFGMRVDDTPFLGIFVFVLVSWVLFFSVILARVQWGNESLPQLSSLSSMDCGKRKRYFMFLTGYGWFNWLLSFVLAPCISFRKIRHRIHHCYFFSCFCFIVNIWQMLVWPSCRVKMMSKHYSTKNIHDVVTI